MCHDWHAILLMHKALHALMLLEWLEIMSLRWWWWRHMFLIIMLVILLAQVRELIDLDIVRSIVSSTMLSEVIGSRECLSTVWADIRSLLSMSADVSLQVL